MTEKPFTVAQVADRWACSRDAVYSLIRERKLRAFRVGGKLLRVTAGEVERWESAGGNTQSGNTDLVNSTERRSSAGATKRGRTAEDLASSLK
ncbi:MAG: helix-turn-helix domain-containing protein [Hyphomicrobium denitrificans]|nr:helix-turn-helix domain-containing protein [Hyphomicrobium denitrificans]